MIDLPSTLSFHVARDFSRSWGYCLYIVSRDGDVMSSAEPIVFKPMDPARHTNPAAVLNQSDAQGLMDALWDAGIRPTEGAGSAGQKAALEKHLEDMRRIAFLYLDGTKP